MVCRSRLQKLIFPRPRKYVVPISASGKPPDHRFFDSIREIEWRLVLDENCYLNEKRMDQITEEQMIILINPHIYRLPCPPIFHLVLLPT